MRRLVSGLVAVVAATAAMGGLFDPEHFQLEHRATPQDLTGLTKMAVHVRLGDTFHAMFYGTTAFQNKGFDAPVPQWGMDPYITAQVVDTMSSAGRFAAAPLDVRDLDLNELYKKSGAILGSREVQDVLLQKARQQGADALMVIEMRPEGNVGNYHGAGFGLFWRDAFGMSHGCLYGSFNTVLIRVDTGKRIGWGGEMPCEVSTPPEHYPLKPAWDQYTPEEQAAFEAAIKQKVGGLVRARLVAYSLLK